MTGGGIGVDYSIIRPEGGQLSRTGGIASGPIPLMKVLNEAGRNVMQGGSRRSALFASLNWRHGDIEEFIKAKDWDEQTKTLKAKDFNYPAPLDMTNISINWDTGFLVNPDMDLWDRSVLQMCKTGEPGHSYNFFENERNTLRNACAEFTSGDDSDVCNLGSVNMARIQSLLEFQDVCGLASKFLVCGGMRADLPYDKVREVRNKNNKIGLGLMGIHEWLLMRSHGYEMVPDLRTWLRDYEYYGKRGADFVSDKLDLPRPKNYQAIAPTGTIGILASTTTGIEPVYATAYKRRYLSNGTTWNYEYVVDATAEEIIKETGVDPDTIETSLSLAKEPEKRIKFQAEVQEFVDMGISSTLNLPAWGTAHNNPDTAKELSGIIHRYAPKLRGLTTYPDGARGGQPLEPVPYHEAKDRVGMKFFETEEKCKGGLCGI
jgi:ribonucleoside-diphosphate reductase alpha chain